jgi:hypothetical protein
MIPTTKFLQADGADTDAYHTQSFNENKIWKNLWNKMFFWPIYPNFFAFEAGNRIIIYLFIYLFIYVLSYKNIK